MSDLNQGWVYEDRVREQNITLLEYYTRHYTHSSQQEWCDRIQSGAISIDQILVTDPNTPLQIGQRLSYCRSPWSEPDVPFDVAILYEDDDLLMLHKPSGLPVLPGGGFLENTLWGWLRRTYAIPPIPIHRLGRGTSGVMVLAKTEEARSRLSKDLRDRKFQKRYRALAAGTPELDHFTVTAKIGKVAYPQLGYLYAATETGKEAISHCVVLERDRLPDATLLEVTIPTGRPHQIRIHLAAAGYPLLGDPLYGAGGIAIGESSIPSDCGYLLHSYELCLTHPTQGHLLAIRSQPPIVLCVSLEDSLD
ncbi:MAG: RluA family pseudouridine synthase [Plectolyngbya sp. WJT66-NPBG17]|jgi:23S rRNA pseudouridine1911/1915/1917 synthase|nr:RluA family pseudouridine synthase [Plectolyngbya sp. WJT66-NPBG17]